MEHNDFRLDNQIELEESHSKNNDFYFEELNDDSITKLGDTFVVENNSKNDSVFIASEFSDSQDASNQIMCLKKYDVMLTDDISVSSNKSFDNSNQLNLPIDLNGNSNSQFEDHTSKVELFENFTSHNVEMQDNLDNQFRDEFSQPSLKKSLVSQTQEVINLHGNIESSPHKMQTNKMHNLFTVKSVTDTNKISKTSKEAVKLKQFNSRSDASRKTSLFSNSNKINQILLMSSGLNSSQQFDTVYLKPHVPDSNQASSESVHIVSSPVMKEVTNNQNKFAPINTIKFNPGVVTVSKNNTNPMMPYRVITPLNKIDPQKISTTKFVEASKVCINPKRFLLKPFNYQSVSASNAPGKTVKILTPLSMFSSTKMDISSEASSGNKTSSGVLTLDGKILNQFLQSKPLVIKPKPIAPAPPKNTLSAVSLFPSTQKVLLSSNSLLGSNNIYMESVSLDGHMSTSQISASSVDTKPKEASVRSNKPCNCAKSQCLKMYCECFAKGQFCNNCNCNNCLNNIINEEERQRAIRQCLERDRNAFKPKIGKGEGETGPERRHTKGCNCRRSGCSKNYCECFEARIHCSGRCRCTGCKNCGMPSALMQLADAAEACGTPTSLVQMHGNGWQEPSYSLSETFSSTPSHNTVASFQLLSKEVIEATCNCLLACACESNSENSVKMEQIILKEFGFCLRKIIQAGERTSYPITPTSSSVNPDVS